MSEKFGYKTVEEFKKNAQKKFSLLETGIAKQPSSRLLLLNVSISHLPEYKYTKNTIYMTYDTNKLARVSMMALSPSKTPFSSSTTAVQRRAGMF